MDYLFMDTETHPFSPGKMAPKTVCMSVARSETQGEILVGDDVRDQLLRALEGAAAGLTYIVGHNVAYDLACAAETWPDLMPLIWAAYGSLHVTDTLIRAKLLDYATFGTRQGKYSLAALAKRFFDIDMDGKDASKGDCWRLNYHKLDNVPVDKWPEPARDYAVTDALITRRLFYAQVDLAEKIPYPAFELEAARQTSFAWALLLLSARGVIVDQAHVVKLINELVPKIDAARQKLSAAGLLGKGGRKNLKAIRARVAAEKHDAEKTAKGSIKTGAANLEACADPDLQTVAELAADQKLLSTYLEALADAGADPIHAHYDVLGAASGRTSCSSPNMQNLPRAPGVRESIVARPGFVFIFCDFDSQEMRTLAQVCFTMIGRSALADRYREAADYDPHSDFVAAMDGLSYAEGLAKRRAGDADFLEKRQRAKAANFGFPGGLGAPKFRKYAEGYGVTLTEEQARALKEAWFRQWPEMQTYFNYIQDLTASGPAVLRHFVTGRLRAGCGFTDAANGFFQGLASDASKAALYEVTKKCFDAPGTSALSGCRPVVFVHDEIGIEAPESYAHEAALELEDTMVQAMQDVCPDIPARASATIMRRWSKKAKPTKDAAGRLIPWEGAC